MTALFCGLAQAAVAESPAVPQVEGGEACHAADIAASAFRRYAPAGADGGDVRAHIELGASGQWHAEVVGPVGRRRVRDATCRVVARAAGVIAALMVREAEELVAVSRGEVPVTALPETEGEGEGEAEAETEGEAETESETEAGAPGGGGGWLAVRVGGGIGAGLGPTGDVAVAWGGARALSVELGARYSRAGVEGPGAGGWDRALTVGRIAACASVARVSGCAGAEGGSMGLDGAHPDEGRLRGRGGWVAPTASVAFSLWRRGALSLRARSAVGYALVKPRFLTSDDELIHTPSRLSAHMSVAIGYRLR